ncbi:MAG: RPA12/RPB9/RPC11 RNA polymerase family protein [Candidatus Bathyarchaeota archaeon]|nr:RPA12/RPB9/RPC11 RNA polymerase family protein [Candidatus Termiticorpusculum sp.]
MEFCPNCGCRLEPQKIDTQVVLACSKCDYTKQAVGNRSQAKVVKVIQPAEQPFMTVITAEDSKINTMSTIKMKCEKCNNSECYVWQVQTRGGDEASTQFMRCTKCGHTFREYT